MAHAEADGSSAEVSQLTRAASAGSSQKSEEGQQGVESHDISEHWAADQTRHGLPACDWSLHGLDSQRAAHPKTTEELQSELMALVDDALLQGTIMLTDSNCDLAHVWSCQPQPQADARQTKPQKRLRERIRQAFGRKSAGCR